MVAIAKKPSVKVSKLSTPARVANTWGWSSVETVSAAAMDGANSARATHVVAEWELDLGLNYKDKNGKWVLKNPRISAKTPVAREQQHVCWVNLGSNWSNGFNNVTRQSFYPLTKSKVLGIHLKMQLWNSKGYGPALDVRTAIETPMAPTLSTPSHAEETGRVSSVVKPNYGWTTNREAYDCSWQIKSIDTRVDTKERVVKSGTSRSNEFTIWYDVADRAQLTYDQYVKLTFEAWERGLRGDGVHTTRSKYISYPGQAKITGVDVPSLEENAKVTVRCSTGSSSVHPVTKLKLQALRSVPYSKAEEIPSTDTWDDVGAVDDGTCTALSLAVSDLRPSRGTRTWVRIKTINEHEELFYRYSAPIELSALYTPPASATDDAIKIISAESGEDGTAVAVTLGWNVDGTDDSTGTELTWSDFEEAWRSTQAPQSFEFEWSDGELVDGAITYHDSARVLVRGLSNGTTYYIRARRYRSGETTTYSDYASTVSVLTGSDPGSVVMMAPQILERGRSLALSWVLGDGPEQTAWEILTGTTVADDKGLAWDTNADQIIVANGDGSTCSCSISSERLESLIQNGNEIPLSVRSSRGGDYAESGISVVRLADAPELTVSIADEVTAQGPTIALGCSINAEVRFTCVANGAIGETPDGMREQATGDIVWSDAFVPDWSGDGPFTATIDMPTGLNLWDGASYTLRAIAKDTETGLECDVVEAVFVVAWARQAPAPSENITVVPSDVIDEDGVRSRFVTITLAAPENVETGDVYDVYRITPDGAYVVAVDQSLDAVVVDQYAPFGDGEKVYRIALRTSDGDFDWLDFPYELEGNDLRIDFGTQYVELPWNVVISDQWEKDFESRAHMGTATPEGYWNDSVKRSANLTTDTVKVGEEEKRELLRQLAQHSGPCFVRTVTGSAFEANVVVSGLEYRYATEVCAVSLSATEVGLTREFMATVTIPEGGDEGEPDPDEAIPEEE